MHVVLSHSHTVPYFKCCNIPTFSFIKLSLTYFRGNVAGIEIRSTYEANRPSSVSNEMVPFMDSSLENMLAFPEFENSLTK